MDKKLLRIIFVVLVVVIAGGVYLCSQKGFFSSKEGTVPDDTATETPQGEVQEGRGDIYASAEEVVALTGLANELKPIFSEACGGAKLISLNRDFPAPGFDMMVYVWENEPTEEKLISAFEENGYELVMPGEILIFEKENIVVEVDWSYQREEQEIVVLTAEKE